MTASTSGEAQAAAGGAASVATVAGGSGDNVDVRNSWRYQLVRCFLILVVFLILHTMFQRFIFDPIFHAAPKRDTAAMREHIRRSICPAGTECEYTLPPDFAIPE